MMITVRIRRGCIRRGGSGQYWYNNVVPPTADISTEDPLSTFFAGVEELRRYVDRNLQDPRRRRSRLAQIAQDLVKNRRVRTLAAYLAEQLRFALGARASAMWVNDGVWACWYRAGAGTNLAPANDMTTAVPLFWMDDPTGAWLPLAGTTHVVAALWLEDLQRPDGSTTELLAALASTAGMLIEQGLAALAANRDPATGLLSATAFVEHAGAEVRLVPSSGRAFVVIGLGHAHGCDPWPAAKRAEMGRALSDAAPPGTVLGTDGGDAFAVFADVPVDRCDREVAILARGIRSALGGAQSAALTYFVSARPIEDLRATMEQVRERLRAADAGSVTRLD